MYAGKQKRIVDSEDPRLTPFHGSDENASNFQSATFHRREGSSHFRSETVHYSVVQVNLDSIAGRAPDVSRHGMTPRSGGPATIVPPVSSPNPAYWWPMATGTLYVVATPIGNLEDITYRAVRILKEVDLIACEDTRESRKLLGHYGIETRAVSYHEHNEAEKAVELVERLQGGQSIALISDAGTPLVSDPGYRLVEHAAAAGIPVVPVPGASAALAALAASGLPTDSFRFAGFLPAKASQRRRALEEIRDETATVIWYETPHRILETLQDMVDTLGARPMVLARELTKLHEEFLRGTPALIRAELEARPSIRGEMTLIVGKGGEPAPLDQSLSDHVSELMQRGMRRMDAIKEAARTRGISKRDAYTQLEAQK